jgi:Alpha/beta hydrolase domain
MSGSGGCQRDGTGLPSAHDRQARLPVRLRRDHRSGDGTHRQPARPLPGQQHLPQDIPHRRGQRSLEQGFDAGDDERKGRPVEIPANVRLYYFASVQHGPTPQPRVGVCTQLSNPAPWEPTLRALFHTLDAWATANVAPPESRFPKTSDGTLAPALPQSAQGFPDIPGVQYTGDFNQIGVVDRSTLPPRHVAGKDYAILVPRVDEDGNEIGGIRGTHI